MPLSATAIEPSAPVQQPWSSRGGDSEWLRDRLVVHKIVVALDEAHPALCDLLDQLARTQGGLQSLDVRPLGSGYEAVLHVSRLSPEAARRLVDRFATTEQVRCASIEHILIR